MEVERYKNILDYIGITEHAIESEAISFPIGCSRWAQPSPINASPSRVKRVCIAVRERGNS